MWIDPGDTALILVVLFILAIAYFVSFVMGGLHLLPRLVILLGMLAGVAQVVWPPCLYVGPYGLPEPVGRHLFPTSYSPTDSGPWIDADRQTIYLLATAAVTVIACGLLEWRQRATASPTAGQ
jgi:hypothetical protein